MIKTPEEDLAWFANFFVSFVDSTPAQYQPLMLSSMYDVLHKMRAVAFEQAGYGSSRGEPRDMWRFKVLFITGEGLNSYVQCVGNTREGNRCRNRPYVGGQHCHAHASDIEKAVDAKNREAWTAETEQVLSAAGLLGPYQEMQARIDQIRESMT